MVADECNLLESKLALQILSRHAIRETIFIRKYPYQDTFNTPEYTFAFHPRVLFDINIFILSMISLTIGPEYMNSNNRQHFQE